MKKTADKRESALPPWATFERDPKQWWELLDSYDCDDTSRQSLFLLAQLSDEEYVAANHLLSKLVKKTADGENIANPSAFIHKGAKNARQDLFPFESTAKKVRK